MVTKVERPVPTPAETSRPQYEISTAPIIPRDPPGLVVNDGGMAESCGLRTPSWSDIRSAIGSVEWEWSKWLPRGFVTMIGAEPGAGKSQIAMRIAQTAVGLAPWPDGTPFAARAGKVLWVETESAWSINIDRADAWGIPVTCFIAPIFDDEIPPEDQCFTFSNAEHVARLEEYSALPEVVMVVIDSLSGGFNGEENKTEFGRAVQNLAHIAKRVQKPFLLVHHIGKDGTGKGRRLTKADMRGHSSVIQYARVIWALWQNDPTDSANWFLEVVKSNFRMPPAISVCLSDGNPPQFSAITDNNTHIQSEQERARDMILRLLATGPKYSDDIFSEASRNSIATKTVECERSRMKRDGIIEDVKEKKPGGRWSWKLSNQREDSEVSEV